ncbi:MAG: CoA transferase [Pseudomonadota bacterium]
MEKEEFYQYARRDLAGPLDGVTVLEATTTWAGPMAGCVLADLGARVIKIEHPDGEVGRRIPPSLPDSELSLFNETVNRNKQSLALDLRDAADREIVYQLVARCDIFLENFRPGTLADWGYGYADLCRHKADIVYVSVSGFGQFGPLSDRVGYDPVAQNYSGWASLNGDPSGSPTKAPTFLCDDLGGLQGAMGAMAALRHRDQTGEGQHVDVALVDSIIFQSNGYPTAGALGLDLPRLGNEFQLACPVNTYACTDGSVFAGVLLDTHWQVLATELQRDDLADLTNVERISQREVMNKLMAQYCVGKTTAEVVSRFAELGLPCTRVNEYSDLADEAHVKARDMFVQTPLSDGSKVPLVGPSTKFSRTPTTIRTHAPENGAHNAQIFKELGLDTD